jgi:hypothetical protein
MNRIPMQITYKHDQFIEVFENDCFDCDIEMIFTVISERWDGSTRYVEKAEMHSIKMLPKRAVELNHRHESR